MGSGFGVFQFSVFVLLADRRKTKPSLPVIIYATSYRVHRPFSVCRFYRYLSFSKECFIYCAARILILHVTRCAVLVIVSKTKIFMSSPSRSTDVHTGRTFYYSMLQSNYFNYYMSI